MIGKLTGCLEDIQGSHLVINVHGVGYLVTCSHHTRKAFSVNETVSLHIETHIRPEHITLYGFSSAWEKQVFNHLYSVQGVGGKMCLALLSALTPDEIVQAILGQNPGPLTRAEGVGQKLAARIVNELKGKNFPLSSLPNSASASSQNSVLSEEALSVLMNLGYSRTQAYQAIAEALRKDEPPNSLGQLLPMVLKQLAAS